MIDLEKYCKQLVQCEAMQGKITDWVTSGKTNQMVEELKNLGSAYLYTQCPYFNYRFQRGTKRHYKGCFYYENEPFEYYEVLKVTGIAKQAQTVDNSSNLRDELIAHVEKLAVPVPTWKLTVNAESYRFNDLALLWSLLQAQFPYKTGHSKYLVANFPYQTDRSHTLFVEVEIDQSQTFKVFLPELN